MRTRTMAAMLGGAAMAFALLPAPASARTGGTAAPPTATTPGGPAVDGRPTPPPIQERGPDPSVPQPDPEPSPAPEPDTVVVKFRDDVVRPDTVEGEAVRDVPESPYDLVEVPEGETADEVAADIADRPDVEFAEPNGMVRAFEAPGQTAEFERIGVTAAWTRAKGSSDVVVAVIDSGIDLDHPDFSGRLVGGFDWVDLDSTPADSDGHGTQTAGIIAARHGGGTNIDGVAGAGTKIMPLRVLNGGTGSLGDVASAIRYAADNGADVVNLSLGGEGRSATVDNAVAYARDRGVVIVASTGNEETFLSNSPANAPGVIGVSATDDNGDIAWFTTFGPDVDLAAPGVAIATTADGGGTTSVNGTSFSAPLVSGVAALLKDRNPGWTGDRIVAELLATAEDRGPTGVDDYYGYGVVDAAAALGVAGRKPFVGVAPAADDAEPNDVRARATAAGATNSGSISPEGDVDWWTFTSAVAEDVTITVTPNASSNGPQFDPVIEIHRPDGALVELQDDAGEGVEVATFTTAPGTYTFSVRNWFGTVSPGGYSLFVARAGATGPADTPEDGAHWLEATTPTARTTGASRTANQSITSGRTLKSASVNETTVVLLDGIHGSVVPASVRLSGGKTIDVNPSSTLLAGRPYVLVLAGVQDAAGNAMPWTTVPFSTSGSFAQPTVNGTYDLVAGDYSGDGATDLLYYAPGGAADYLALGDWSGLFDLGAYPVNGTYEPFTLDLDGNGHDDIVWYAPGPAPDFIWYADSSGFESSPTKASGVYEPFTLDLNGDGFDDIVWYAPGPAQDYIWYGKPGGGHTSVATKASGRYEPFVGDFDGDGFDDTFWYAPGGAQDYIWYGKATGFDSVPTTVNGSYRPISGDFDGDGYGDVLFYAPGTAPDYQWRFRAGGFDSAFVRIDGNYEPAGGDFNGDRYDDVYLYGPGATGDFMLLGGESGIL